MLLLWLIDLNVLPVYYVEATGLACILMQPDEIIVVKQASVITIDFNFFVDD